MIKSKTKKNVEVKVSLRVNETGARLVLEGRESGLRIAEVSIDPDNFLNMLGGLCNVSGSAEFYSPDKIGLTQEHKKFEFLLPEHNYRNKEQVAQGELKRVCPEGWEPDEHFNSQGSFFEKGDEKWARITIRRWYDKQD
jgi:hypothetical protein